MSVSEGALAAARILALTEELHGDDPAGTAAGALVGIAAGRLQSQGMTREEWMSLAAHSWSSQPVLLPPRGMRTGKERRVRHDALASRAAWTAREETLVRELLDSVNRQFLADSFVVELAQLGLGPEATRTVVHALMRRALERVKIPDAPG